LESRKLVICLANFASSQQRYEEFRIKFEERIGYRLTRFLGQAKFLRFNEDQTSEFLNPVNHSELVWPIAGSAIDLRQTLWPFLSRLHAEPSREPPRTRTRWLDVAAALGIYFVLALVLIAPVERIAIGLIASAERTALAAQQERKRKEEEANYKTQITHALSSTERNSYEGENSHWHLSLPTGWVPNRQRLTDLLRSGSIQLDNGFEFEGRPEIYLGVYVSAESSNSQPN
jgi:hypothetical protein